MATYAIGDVQGCFGPLQDVLEEVGFDDRHDRLWLVGDLVNRGPDSAATVRFVRDMGARAVTVLGNHDLHLLACAEGLEKPRKGDTLDDILDAPDRADLLAWLRSRSLMHVDHGYAMVHAGLLPQWTVERARRLAAEVEFALTGPHYREFLAHMYGNKPARWDERLTGYDRLRVIVNAMTRLRLCTKEGEMEFAHKGRPDHTPHDYLPWFAIPARASRTMPVIFGHWSALGLVREPDLFGLDTGCVWGRRLTALRLDDGRLFQVPCRKPGRRARTK